MLKFLTHKLRTHSLNEELVSEKVEEHDSGTESDDEADRADTGDFCTDVIMKWNDVTDNSMSGAEAAGANAGAAGQARICAASVEPDPLYDHHSSEEELEVINGAAAGGEAPCAAESRRRAASSPPPEAAPEKRKWPSHRDADDAAARAPSSDDDDTKVETPVRFRTSPPLEALKPRRAGAGSACACSAAAGGGPGGRAPLSPRRRRVQLPAPRRHRPALDFDKMQQLRVGGGGVRSWRAVGGAHGGELSVFCW